jgi:peptidoglycan/xylan/chitin deacetylase (PgdA/CDA1 family)
MGPAGPGLERALIELKEGIVQWSWSMGPISLPCVTRRSFLVSPLLAGLAAGSARAITAPSPTGKALVAITLDLEMSRNFPTWDQTHWDYEKGNLDAPTKRYAAEAARRVKASGGVVHFFAVGQTMEQEDVTWLREIVAQGHPVGNHTYDHVNVKATRAQDIQFRFRRAPWLIDGKTPADVIAENIRLAEAALKQRLGIAPNGFRTPGGFANGLADRPDLQTLLLKMGYTWVSSQYPAHAIADTAGKRPDEKVMSGIISVQRQAQPFVYPSGLVEVPMSPISDVTAFRTGRWPLEAFLDAIRSGVAWAIEHRSVYCFLGHPSCLVVADQEFQTIEAICSKVREAGDRAAFADLGTIANRIGRNGRT